MPWQCERRRQRRKRRDYDIRCRPIFRLKFVNTKERQRHCHCHCVRGSVYALPMLYHTLNSDFPKISYLQYEVRTSGISCSYVVRGGIFNNTSNEWIFRGREKIICNNIRRRRRQQRQQQSHRHIQSCLLKSRTSEKSKTLAAEKVHELRKGSSSNRLGSKNVLCDSNLI